MIGKIDILHVTKGHEEFHFNDPNEAKNKIDELIKGGYILSAAYKDDNYKVSGFDLEKAEYIATSTGEVRIPLADAKVTAIPPTAGG